MRAFFWDVIRHVYLRERKVVDWLGLPWVGVESEVGSVLLVEPGAMFLPVRVHGLSELVVPRGPLCLEENAT